MKTKGTLEYLKGLRDVKDIKYKEIRGRIEDVEDKILKLKSKIRELQEQKRKYDASGIRGHISRMEKNGLDSYETRRDEEGWKAMHFFKNGVEYIIDTNDASYERMIPKED